MSKEGKYDAIITEFLKGAPLPNVAAQILDCVSTSGCVVVHEPTGIMGASVEEVNWKLNKHYQKIIDSQIQFTHVMKFK